MSASFPTGVPANGNVKVSWVATIADMTAPTATALNAGVDITCGIVGGGFTPGATVNTSQDIRLCSRQVFDSVGDTAYTIDDIEFIVTPQDVSPTGENKIGRTLAANTTGYIVVRWGAPYEDAYAADDVVDVYHVTLGPQVKQAPERNSTLRAKVKPYVVSPGAEIDVEVV